MEEDKPAPDAPNELANLSFNDYVRGYSRIEFQVANSNAKLQF